MARRRDVRAVPRRPVVGERELAGVLRRLPAGAVATAPAPAAGARSGRRRPRPPPAPRRPRRPRPRPPRRPPPTRSASRSAAPAPRIVANMEAQPRRPDGHQLPRGPGQAARGQPQGHQRLPRPHPGGKVSFTHLIGYAVVRAIADAVPVMNNALRRGRRRQAAGRPPRARQPRPRRRRREVRRQPHAGRAGASSDADTLDFAGFLGRLRGPDPQGPHQQAHPRRLRRAPPSRSPTPARSAPCSRCRG